MNIAQEESGSELLVARASVRDAQRARQNAQRMRVLAAERAVRLESRLKDAAEHAARADIARTLAARRRLRAVQRVAIETQALRRIEQGAVADLTKGKRQPVARKAFARYLGAAAMGLFVGAVVTVMTPFAADLSGSRERVAGPAGLFDVPGDGLKLTFSDTISAPVTR